MEQVYGEQRRWSCHVLCDLWLKVGPVVHVQVTPHDALPRGYATYLVFE